MTDTVVEPATGLSEVERVVDTFIAPGKTFTDIRRKATWWLPFVLMVLVSLIFVTAVDKKVGFEAVAQHNMEKNKFAAERMDSLPPDQKAAAYAKAAKQTQFFSFLWPVRALLSALGISLLWWLTTNFALGANTKFSQIFAIWMYSALPKVLMSLLAAVLLFAGVGIDSFDIQNPIGTNIGYYLSDSSAAVKAAAGFIDVFALWTLYLAILGISKVSGKSKGQASIVVLGWWLVGLVLSVAGAAFTS